jgi:hypothetical protein
MPPRRTLLLTLGILISVALPSAAEGSIKIAGNAKNPVLRVNAKGFATVTYTVRGRRTSAVVTPRGRVLYGRRAGGGDVSLPSVGVALPMLVTLRVSPTGRFFALQSWRRLKRGPVELRFSRWFGPPTLLTLGAVCCKWRSEIVRGHASFHGRPIFGYGSTPSGNPTDKYGRNVYLDTYRRGAWRRMMGILARRPTGFFRLWIRPYWRGSSYRGRISGPNWGRTLAPDAEAWAPSVL